MNIGAITWPSDPHEASKLYLRFVVDIVEDLKLRFPGELSDPVASANSYIAGRTSEEKYRAKVDVWWAFLDSKNQIREMQDKSALSVRVGICLLAANSGEAGRLGEHLSWFLELLGLLGVNLDAPLRKMETHFAP